MNGRIVNPLETRFKQQERQRRMELREHEEDCKYCAGTDSDTTKGLVDYNNAAIGDKVPYVLTSKVPDMTGYTKYYYVVTDNH